MRKLGILLAIIGLVFTFSMPAMAAEAGNWDVTYDGPFGPETWVMVCKADGTIDAENPMMGPVKGKHNISGDKFDALFNLETPMGPMDFHFVGKRVGPKATGTIELMGAPTDWVAEKK